MAKLFSNFTTTVFFVFLFIQNTFADVMVSEPTKAQALAILKRIEQDPNAISTQFLDNLKIQAAKAEGVDLLRANYQLLLYAQSEETSAQEYATRLAQLAQDQGNGSYYAIAKGYQVFNQFLDGEISDAIPKLERELEAARANKDWLAESQVSQFLTYVAWGSGKREYAIHQLTEAFDIIPDSGKDADFARMSLLSVLRYVQSDSGDLNALLETSAQILDLSARTGLPSLAHEIVRNFAYLFRLRGEYEIALEFYQTYDQLLIKTGQGESRYYAIFGLALTAHRMGDYALSAQYVDQALSRYPDRPVYDAPLNVIQAINLAQLGKLEDAKRHFTKAEDYFNNDTSSYNDSWRAELLHARSAMARTAGDYERALELSDMFLERYINLVRAESSNEVQQLRADLAAELGRERAERELLERERELQSQRLQGQTITLVFLAIFIVGLSIAFLLQRRTAHALNVARQRAEAANIAKSRFLANMSHELRTPLNAVIGFSEMMMMDGPAPIRQGQAKEYAGLINKSGHHLLDIITDILNVAQVETSATSIMRNTCSFHEILNDARIIIDRQAEQCKKRIIYRTADDLPDLCVDKRRMTQVLVNLLTNALKFTGETPHIELSVRLDGERNFIITVVDDGIGIPADKLHTVTDPFVQASDGWDRVHSGVGLGLSIVKSIIEQHDGTISIWSKLGHGTSITITLPSRCLAIGNVTTQNTTTANPVKTAVA